MSPDTIGMEAAIALTVVKTLVLIVGGIITYFSFKAYRRTRQRALGYLATGFGIVTLGLVIAGFAHELLNVPLAIGILIESLLVLVGFVIIAYSLYVQ
ncbi:DUF7521 family protein [Natrialbaceae archaeon AArc-T1-2]|uniref:DUF7521 family protein n=1 Tax=Natrialbaceae archaeon AArc-T1-2 TaxID=3053904 RepID=UPI00255AC39E|nr:hypothetical protein [Natrialbaceae archaeon AArc-T1-2]WIV68292.1 hypothetical protein QQ977_06100 [Natrialbaceae archaeon AArc-T1-2]